MRGPVHPEEGSGAAPDVTVVVPCYNTERFLDQALRSIEANDRIDLEIIVLNDGSTDGSLQIMEQHAAADPRVRVIDKANEGYGATVNRGIDEARGAYVAIVEPDDYVDPHMYDDLVDVLRGYTDDLRGPQAPDVLKGAYWRVQHSGTDHETNLQCSYHRRALAPGTRQPFTLKDAPRLVRHHPSIWSALYRKGFLDEKAIRFKEVPGAGWVDNPWLFETLGQAGSIVYDDRPYYHYREDLPGSSSSTRGVALSLERWNDMLDVCERIGLDDPGVLGSLYLVGFRYVGEAVKQGALADSELSAAVTALFSRMDPAIMQSIPEVSPQLKELAFTLRGEEPPHFSRLPYLASMAGEFWHSLTDNGPKVALERIGLFFQRDAAEREAQA